MKLVERIEVLEDQRKVYYSAENDKFDQFPVEDLLYFIDACENQRLDRKTIEMLQKMEDPYMCSLIETNGFDEVVKFFEGLFDAQGSHDVCGKVKTE